MTVIAWDGKTLAADKQSTLYGYGSKVTKIFRVGDALVALSGNGPHAVALLEWYKAGAEWHKHPKPATPDDSGNIVVIDANGVREYVGTTGYYSKNESNFVAYGCGRDYALAAMHLGKTAKEAVEVACALDTQCGMGVDVLELGPHS